MPDPFDNPFDGEYRGPRSNRSGPSRQTVRDVGWVVLGLAGLLWAALA